MAWWQRALRDARVILTLGAVMGTLLGSWSGSVAAATTAQHSESPLALVGGGRLRQQAPLPTPPVEVAPAFASGVAAGAMLANSDSLEAQPRTVVVATPEGAEERLAARALTTLVNAERQARGLAPLEEAPGLIVAARLRALEVDSRLSHQRPNGPLRELFEEAGIDWHQGAENLAYLDSEAPAPRAAAAAHELLMSSPGHRHNLLAPEHRYLGVGVSRRGETWFFVELFAG